MGVMELISPTAGQFIGILMHREMDDIRLIEYLREDEMSKYYKKIYTSDIIDGKVREEEEWNILRPKNDRGQKF